MSVNLCRGSGFVRFRSGYCCHVYIDPDQDRDGSYEVHSHKDYGLIANRIFGLYQSDGSSWWDGLKRHPADQNQGRLLPFDQEIVAFDPDVV